MCSLAGWFISLEQQLIASVGFVTKFYHANLMYHLNVDSNWRLCSDFCHKPLIIILYHLLAISLYHCRETTSYRIDLLWAYRIPVAEDDICKTLYCSALKCDANISEIYQWSRFKKKKQKKTIATAIFTHQTSGYTNLYIPKNLYNCKIFLMQWFCQETISAML